MCLMHRGMQYITDNHGLVWVEMGRIRPDKARDHLQSHLGFVKHQTN